VAVVVVVVAVGDDGAGVCATAVAGVDGPAFTSVYQGVIRFQYVCGTGGGAGGVSRRGRHGGGAGDGDHDSLINVLCVLVLSAHAGGSISVNWGVAGLDHQSADPGLSGRDRLESERDRLAVGLGGDAGYSGAGGVAVGSAGGRARACDWTALNRPGLLVAVSALKLLASCRRWRQRYVGWCNPVGWKRRCLMTFAALPGASTAYILARQLGGDAPLIAAIRHGGNRAGAGDAAGGAGVGGLVEIRGGAEGSWPRRCNYPDIS
jgi:malonate transporter